MSPLELNSGLLIFAYLLGSIPFGLLVAKAKKVDLRKVGSGNTGATNIYRSLGFKYAAFVFLLDAVKGFIPTFISMLMLHSASMAIIVGLMAIVGHCLPVFAGFKGGKGAATGLGALLAISPDVFCITAILAAVIIWITRYVSLATICSCIILPALLVVFHYPRSYALIVGAICLFVLYRHKSNIGRLIKGQENKV